MIVRNCDNISRIDSYIPRCTSLGGSEGYIQVTIIHVKIKKWSSLPERSNWLLAPEVERYVDQSDEYDEDYDDEDDMDDFIDDAPLEEDVSKHIREIFGYDKRKYRYIDDDDDDNFDDDDEDNFDDRY